MLVFDWSISITYCSTCAVTKLLTKTPTSRKKYDNMTKTLGVQGTK